MAEGAALTRFVDRHADDLWLWSKLNGVSADSDGMACLRKCNNRYHE
jgi:hypothetical protein